MLQTVLRLSYEHGSIKRNGHKSCSIARSGQKQGGGVYFQNGLGCELQIHVPVAEKNQPVFSGCVTSFSLRTRKTRFKKKNALHVLPSTQHPDTISYPFLLSLLA